MSNVKQSILVQRQIPEHIRESYPVFVEFVKLYYDFLQETQSQDLERIRDIDTTLDEFVEKFKSEVAKNFPSHLAGDQRLLLKHIREFYLSRGSEASYKFLFRTLFGKEATLFYPGTQVLRASDGKWTQDISIFVKIDASTSSLFELQQQFILITTSKKTIQTFVNKVNQYSDDIYEVFIQRDYANEIEVGSTVSYTSSGVTYSGNIVKCPSKISIYKPGKGFKIGDLYALKTSLGRGCVVKITKTDSNGGIKAVQVIRFGLDYETTFYSYLSSKNVAAFEYVHPLKLNATGAQPAYNERSGGFVDYGFASKQTYFAYDDTIPVGTTSNSADRYYADSSYVGDIQQQFYADQTTKVIDEDLAIIKIDLGAVAKYPGYYSTVDGFISDEMYIHDGNYYQSFSYLIKVEEELKKYSDIVKALVHPAGTKSFSEYKIQTILKLTATAPLLFKVLSLPAIGKTPSIVATIDELRRVMAKSILDTSTIVDSSSNWPTLNKTDSFSFSEDALYKEVYKALSDATSGFEEALVKAAAKSISDSAPLADDNFKSSSKTLDDSISELDLLSNWPTLSKADSFSFADDSLYKIIDKALSDATIGFDEALARAMSKDFADASSTVDTTVLTTNKSFDDVISQFVEEVFVYRGYGRYFDDSMTVPDFASFQTQKDLQDGFPTLLDAIAFVYNRALQEDTFTAIDSTANTSNKGLTDSINSMTDGRIALSSYDGESFFDVFDDYQTYTTIS